MLNRLSSARLPLVARVLRCISSPFRGRNFFLFEGIDDLMVNASEKPTSSEAILARVQDIFRAELDDEDLVIGPETSQKNLNSWDSLAHIRLVSGIESEFDIQFTLTEIEQITSVRQFVQLIEERSR